MAGYRHSQVKAEQGRPVIGPVGEHGANHANIIDPLCQAAENIADFDSALSIFLKAERRLHEIPGATLRLRIPSRRWFAVILVEHGLGIKGVDM